MNARQVGIAALYGLVVLQVLWHGWLARPTHVPIAVVLAVALVPLLPALWLSRRNPHRALVLGGMVGLFYFCHGVMEAWSDPAVRWLAVAETVFVVVLIGALGWATISEKRQRRLAKS